MVPQLWVVTKLSGRNPDSFFRKAYGKVNDNKSAGIRVRAAMSKFPIIAFYSFFRASFSGRVTKAMHDEANGASTRSILPGAS